MGSPADVVVALALIREDVADADADVVEKLCFLVVAVVVAPPVLSCCLNIISDATDDDEDSRNKDL